MVLTRNMVNEKILDVEKMTLLMYLHRERTKMKQKNKYEIQALQKENVDIRKNRNEKL